jgi:uncharacterized membrane protein
MQSETNLDANFQVITIAVIVAIILGLVTLVFFMEIDKDSYSAIYLVPDSIAHNTEYNTILYTYGVTSSESQKTDYTLETYLGDKIIKTKTFSLKNGETLEERVMTILPADTQYPEKITLNLSTGTNSESVHFWIHNA